MRTLFIFFGFLFIFYAASAQKTPCNDADSHSGSDTTIVLANGTQVTFNRCDFFDFKDCIELTEVRTVKDLEERGLNTMDNDGNLLLTCGMFIFKINQSEDCGNVTCLQRPVRIRIPELKTPCMSNLSVTNNLYSIDAANRWTRMDGGQEITDSSGTKYLQFSTMCGGKFNCDQKFSRTAFNVKFKTRKYKKINAIKVTSNCPLMRYSCDSSKRNKVMYIRLPCANPDSLMITVFLTDANGESIKITKPLSQFISKFTRSSCPEISKIVKRRILGIFPLRERNIYHKYLVD